MEVTFSKNYQKFDTYLGCKEHSKNKLIGLLSRILWWNSKHDLYEHRSFEGKFWKAYGIQLWVSTKKIIVKLIPEIQNKMLRNIVNPPKIMRNDSK